jgi:hypothetical protein
MNKNSASGCPTGVPDGGQQFVLNFWSKLGQMVHVVAHKKMCLSINISEIQLCKNALL